MEYFEQPDDDLPGPDAWEALTAPMRPVMTAILTMTGHTPASRGGHAIVETVIMSAYPEAGLVVLTYPQVEIREPDPITLGGVVRAVNVPPGLKVVDVFSAEMRRLLRGGWRPISQSERAA